MAKGMVKYKCIKIQCARNWKRLTKNKQKLRFKELRSYYATYLRNRGILAEYIDLLQGRMPKSIFARHYLKVEDFKVLEAQLLSIIDKLEKDIVT